MPGRRRGADCFVPLELENWGWRVCRPDSIGGAVVAGIPPSLRASAGARGGAADPAGRPVAPSSWSRHRHARGAGRLVRRPGGRAVKGAGRHLSRSGGGALLGGWAAEHPFIGANGETPKSERRRRRDSIGGAVVAGIPPSLRASAGARGGAADPAGRPVAPSSWSRHRHARGAGRLVRRPGGRAVKGAGRHLSRSGGGALLGGWAAEHPFIGANGETPKSERRRQLRRQRGGSRPARGAVHSGDGSGDREGMNPARPTHVSPSFSAGLEAGPRASVGGGDFVGKPGSRRDPGAGDARAASRRRRVEAFGRIKTLARRGTARGRGCR